MNLGATSGRPLTIRTGSDDNGDLIFNDRPAGVGRNSVRVPGQWTSSANFGYAFSFGSRQVASGGGVSITQAAGGALTVNVAGSQPVARYRLNLSVNHAEPVQPPDLQRLQRRAHVALVPAADVGERRQAHDDQCQPDLLN